MNDLSSGRTIKVDLNVLGSAAPPSKHLYGINVYGMTDIVFVVFVLNSMLLINLLLIVIRFCYEIRGLNTSSS